MSGIATVDINLVTGSILVNYNPKAVHEKDIIGLLQRKGYFDAAKALTSDQYLQGVASKAGNIVGRRSSEPLSRRPLKDQRCR